MSGRSLSFSIFLALIGLSACGSSGPGEGPTSPAIPSGTTSAAHHLDGVWSTGPVPIEDIRAALVAADFDAEAVESWIESQRSPSEITFELRFDSPDFTHSREDAHFPLQVDESGGYVFADGELRLSFPDLGDAYVFEATLSDDTLSLELTDQRETGSAEDAETHRLYTIALYASAPFVRQP